MGKSSTFFRAATVRFFLWCYCCLELCQSVRGRTGWWDIPGRPQNPYVNGEPMCHFHGNWEKIDYSITRSEYPAKSDSWKTPTTTLWVGIASFRDVLCSRTLYNLFTKAKYPERITVGVVEQKNQGDSFSCLDDYCARFDGPCPYKEQINIMAVDAQKSTGPTFGRALQFQLLNDEEFCMQIDSHMDFSHNWDSSMLEMWGQINNEYAVLSTYVQDLKNMDQNVNGVWETAHLCELIFSGKMPRNEQAKACRTLSEPKLTTVWAAGLSFLKCHGERLTPYDPNLPGIFDGEEYTKGIRLFTHGYDMYTPHRSYVYHDYSHAKTDGRAHTWSRKTIKASQERIMTLLEMNEGDKSAEAKAKLGKYGLGPKRTIDQYINFTGVDIRNRKSFANSCGNVAWVPFQEKETDEAVQDNIRRGYLQNPNLWSNPDSVNQGTLSHKLENQRIQQQGPIEAARIEAANVKHSLQDLQLERENQDDLAGTDENRLYISKLEVQLSDSKNTKEILAISIFALLVLFIVLLYFNSKKDFLKNQTAKRRLRNQINGSSRLGGGEPHNREEADANHHDYHIMKNGSQRHRTRRIKGGLLTGTSQDAKEVASTPESQITKLV